MYGTKSIAPTYSALFRFAAYLKIDLNTYLVSRAPRTRRAVLSQNCLAGGRQPHLPARGTPLPRRHAPGAHVRRSASRRRTYAPGYVRVQERK